MSNTAAELITAKKEIVELKRQLELQTKRAEAADPVVIVKYMGKRPDFVYKNKYDFSTGTCEMLKSEATALTAFDPRCFKVL